jgi:hypothetical protein
MRTTDLTKLGVKKPCHGCGGRGWIDAQNGAQICPVCGGSGKERGGYYDGWDGLNIRWIAGTKASV